MKHPGQRIRLLPARRQPRRQVVLLILLHQSVKDQPAHMFRLRIRPLPQVQIVRAALQNHHHRPRLPHRTVAPNHPGACQHHRSATNPGAPSFRAFCERVGYSRECANRIPPCCRNSHPYDTFPSTAARFAPVAAGTVPAIPFHVSHASSAKATPSFACASIPAFSSGATLTPNIAKRSASIRISVAFRAPPPATNICVGRLTCNQQKRSYDRQTLFAVNAVAVAITSSLRAPLHIFRNRSTNALPNSSRPHDFGGGAEK